MERCTGQALAGPQLCTLRLARRILEHAVDLRQRGYAIQIRLPLAQEIQVRAV